MTDLNSCLADMVAVEEDLVQVQRDKQRVLEQESRLLKVKQMLQEKIDIFMNEKATEVKSKNYSKTEFKWSVQIKELMKSVFKVDKLRPLQLETMNLTLCKEDCFLVMPTGGGKSLCFQIPALISVGITLVISPLVSLMEDQVMALEALEVPVACLTASSTTEEIKWVHRQMTSGKPDIKLLYVTPEKLAKSKRFMAALEKLHKAKCLARIAIDEVHCCSIWGHDFRPGYKFLGILRRQFPGVPILGLTATATPAVLSDVKKILQVENATVFKSSFNRPNLYYEVQPKPNKENCIPEIVCLINTRFKEKSGIIYCFSCYECEQLAEGLSKAGVKALPYHGQLDSHLRKHVHQKWQQDRIKVVVATIAFGMGIDKPNVAFVIHHSMSKSMENYYQESGRAGRDGQPASCILFYSFADIIRQSTMVFTDQTGLEKLFQMVTYCLGASKCRRKLIAQYFAETRDNSECKSQCDICSNQSLASTQENVVNYLTDILGIIEKANKKDSQVTAYKLMDSWRGTKGSMLSQNQKEQVLVHLILQDYLKMKFRFTPYTTLCYIQPGPRSAHVSKQSQIIMTLMGTGISTYKEWPKRTPRARSKRKGRQAQKDGGKKIVTKKPRNSIECIEISSDEEEEEDDEFEVTVTIKNKGQKKIQKLTI
ncbi:ATP-dependent DNA helicase Q1-like [Antedon mediterranea]|uniref:ATP-dependent DNA helicase Q1-like n=1 Tax=Antedon mediterranea TaxID=105859 RepID=UPI003AF69EA6